MSNENSQDPNATAKAPASPWQSVETIGPDAFLGAVPEDGAIRLPQTNIVISSSSGSVFEPEKVDGVRKSFERKLKKGAIILDALSMAEISSERIADVQVSVVEGQLAKLVDPESNAAYILTPSALSDILKMLKIDWQTYQNVQDPDIRASMVNYRLNMLAIEVATVLSEKAAKQADIQSYSLFVTFADDAEKQRKIALAARIAPSATLTIDDVYPRQTVKFLSELHDKHKVAMIRMESNLPFLTDPDKFLELDPDAPPKVNYGTLLGLDRKHGNPYLSARSIDTVEAFSIFQGDKLSPSQTFTTECAPSGAFEKGSLDHGRTEFASGLYRYTCSNGMSVMVNQSDLVDTSLRKFFASHGDDTVAMTYYLDGEAHQISVTAATFESALPNRAIDIACSASNHDSDLQGLIAEVNRAADTAKKRFSVTNGTCDIFNTVMSARRAEDKKHLLDLLQKMQARAQQPIFADIQTTLSAPDLALHLVGAAKTVGTAMKIDPTLVRNVCVALLLSARKADNSDVYKLTNWHVLNLITLAAHGLTGDKRAAAEQASAEWANNLIRMAQYEAAQDRHPSATITQQFARLIHERKPRPAAAPVAATA